MSVSFQSNLTQTAVSTSSYQQKNQTKAQKMQHAKNKLAKNLHMSEITDGTEPFQKENNDLLRKAQFAATKEEALSQYFGAMQTAAKESGSRGGVALKRVGHLMDTEEAFEESAIYQYKKEKENFLLEQLEAMEKKQQEMEDADALAAEREETKKGQNSSKISKDSAKSSSEENAFRSSSNKIKKTAGTSSDVKTDVQKNAAKMYKVIDSPKQIGIDAFNGMI